MIKDILVHMDATAAASRRLDLALMLAERTEAHVVGLYVDSFEQMLMYSDVYAVASLMEVVAEEAAREATDAHARFDRSVAGRAVATEWCEVKGSTDRKVAEAARYVDMVVLGQHDPEDPVSGSGGRVAETVPLTCGKPCLIVPHASGPTTFAETILLAWDGSREASRAASDAMPLLRAAGRVTIAQIEAASGDPFPGGPDLTAFSAHLARHGIAVEARSEPQADRSIAQALLSIAAGLSADLIVMGSYGHTRLRELILGGVTREILAATTVPLLMSH